MAADEHSDDANPTAESSEIPDDAAVTARVEAASSQGPPSWLNKWVWQSLLKVVAVGLATTFFLAMAWRTQTVLRLLALSLFFAIAMVPGVNHLHQKRGWKRGTAVGAIYTALVVFLIFMVAVLIPGISDFAGKVAEDGDDWISQLNNTANNLIGRDLVGRTQADEALISAEEAIDAFAENLGGLASTGIGLFFSVSTIALFSFYFAADWPRIQAALLSRMPPHRQRSTGRVIDLAIEETGGYFYSRLALMVINGGLFFVVMMLVGMPLTYALPLSIFEGFVAEFIPAAGTYIGAAVPIVLTLAFQGLGSALVLLAWTLIYQQAENYWLSPKLSARTMSINGGVAFGAALAGAAIAGPMGAFVALPVAALATSLISNSGRTYAIVYESRYSEEPLEMKAELDGESPT